MSCIRFDTASLTGWEARDATDPSLECGDREYTDESGVPVLLVLAYSSVLL